MTRDVAYFLIMVTGHHVSYDGHSHTIISVIGLTDVFISELMRQPYALRLVFYRLAVYNGVLEVINNGFVDRMALPTRKQILTPYQNKQHTKSSTVEAVDLSTTGAV